MPCKDSLPESLRNLYEIYDFHHAAAILANEFPEEFGDICTALEAFKITDDEIMVSGGNESPIPKKFSDLLRPKGWVEENLVAKMTVNETVVSYDTHAIDYVKGRVAFDLEWNSKDQTFDRDLFAFSTFFAYDRISVAVLVTRSTKLHDYFKTLGHFIDRQGQVRLVKNKFGASTTHVDKLLHRLRSGRNRGCPILVFGITQKCIVKSLKNGLRTRK